MAQHAQLTLDAAPKIFAPDVRRVPLRVYSASEVPRFTMTADIDSLEIEWREFERRADCTPFQTFDWLSTWQRCIGARTGVTPAIVLGRRQTGDLLFILPLAIERTKFLRQLTFLGNAACDYNAPLLAPEFSREVPARAYAAHWESVHALVRGMHPYDIVHFDKMPCRIGSQINPLCALSTMLHPSSAHSMALQGDWDAFYSKKRSSATRRNDRKKRKKLAELGEVGFFTPDTVAGIQETFATLAVQKSRSFKRMGVQDLFAKPGYTEFFASVATYARSLVHVSELKVGSVCTAANLGLTFRGCYFHILASYDDGPVARFGPGAAHLHELMRNAIGNGCTRFDFTIGDEPYKLDWSDTKMGLYDHVSGRGVVGRAGAALMIAALRIKRFIKNSPAIWRLTCRLRAALGSWSDAVRAATRADEAGAAEVRGRGVNRGRCRD